MGNVSPKVITKVGTVLLVTALIFGSIPVGVASPTGDGSSQVKEQQQVTTTVTGAAFAVPDSLQSEIEDYRSRLPRDFAPNTFVLANDDEAYIVFTDREPTEGLATVEGTELQQGLTAGGMSFAVITATSVSVQTSGEPTTIQDVTSNPEQYGLEFVEIEAHHRQISVLNDPDKGQDLTLSVTAGVLTEEPVATNNLFQNPVEKAQSLSVASNPEEQINSLLGDTEPRLFTFNLKTNFWSDSEATVDGVVLLPGSKAIEFVSTFDESGVVPTGKDEPLLYVVERRRDSQRYQSISTLKQEASDGNSVSIRANLFGTKSSLQETLRGSTEVFQDILIHSGVAWTTQPDSEEELLFVVGLSSNHLDSPSEPIKGEYQIEGKVVPSSKIDEKLPDGRVLMVSEFERVGGLDNNGVPENSHIIQNKFGILSNSTRNTEFESDDQSEKSESMNGEEWYTSSAIDRVSAGSEEWMAFRNLSESGGVRRIGLSANRDLQSVVFRVRNDIELSESIQNTPEGVIRTIELDAINAPDSAISSVEIHFWIRESMIPPQHEPIVYKYSNKSWHPIETKYFGNYTSDEGITYAHFEAQSSGFSYFAIATRPEDSNSGVVIDLREVPIGEILVYLLFALIGFGLLSLATGAGLLVKKGYISLKNRLADRRTKVSYGDAISSDQPSFFVQFVCKNCGDEWSSDFWEGEKVVDDSEGRVVVRGNDRSGKIVCPTCSSSENIHVEDRRPFSTKSPDALTMGSWRLDYWRKILVVIAAVFILIVLFG